MTEITKKQILEALEVWLTDNNFSANEFAAKSGIPANYISYMRKGQNFIPVKEKDVEIGDKYFLMIAETIGFDLGNKVVWEIRQTPQLMQTLSLLEDARDYGYTTIIIGATGSGKSFATDIFIKKYQRDTFKVTVGSTDTLKDLLDKLCIEMRILVEGSHSKKINSIIKELQKMKLSGRKPCLIWDEAEFMKQPTLCNIKEMYDHLYGKCGLVLIGTDQLLAKIEKLKNRNADGMPQFYRRVKYGIRELRAIDTNFVEFLTNITDYGLRRFLKTNCTNYGDLHEVLVPSMREAERLNEPLTESLVRKVLNIRK